MFHKHAITLPLLWLGHFLKVIVLFKIFHVPVPVRVSVCVFVCLLVRFSVFVLVPVCSAVPVRVSRT
jgi:hypothetical protein